MAAAMVVLATTREVYLIKPMNTELGQIQIPKQYLQIACHVVPGKIPQAQKLALSDMNQDVIFGFPSNKDTFLATSGEWFECESIDMRGLERSG